MRQPGVFFVYFHYFQSNITSLQQFNVKISIQYPVPGFELTTFWFQVSSLDHDTKASVQINHNW